MLPFPIISNTNIRPKIQIKKMGVSSSAIWYLTTDGRLYRSGRNVGGVLAVGSADGNLMINTFTLLRSDVNNFWCSGSSSVIIFTVLNSGTETFYFAGNTAAFMGTSGMQSLAVQTYNTAFQSIGASTNTIKDIEIYYDLKVTVLMNNGSIYCMGKNNNTTQSSFGNGTNVDSFSTFVLVNTGLGTVVPTKISGNYFIGSDNALYGTGISTSYQLGTNVSRTTYNKIRDNVTDIQAAYAGVYVIVGGLLYITGKSLGNYGEFGDGSVASTTYQVLTKINQAGSNIMKVYGSVGNVFANILQSSNLFMNTGNNNVGFLGNGSTNTVYTWENLPLPFVNSTDNVNIFCNNSNSFILINDNILYGTGSGYGALGSNSTNILTYTHIPLQL